MSKRFIEMSVYAVSAASFICRSSKALSGPVSVFIEPTNICNLKCPLCASGAGLLARPKGRMSLAAFSRIIDSLPSTVTNLYLWGQGEPFLTKDFLGMVRYASERGYKTITSTNGHFLDDPEAILASSLSELIISLDGITKEQYESYRIGGDFDLVTGNIKRLVSKKKEKGRGPSINLQFLLTKDTVDDMAGFHRLADDLGVDKRVVKTIQAVSLEDGEQFLPSDLSLTRYRRKLDGRLVPDRYGLLEHRCLRIYNSCQIDWQGNMLPCCFDKDSTYKLGNLFNETFDECWNGEESRSFRRMFLKGGRRLPMCQDCTEGLKRSEISGRGKG